MTIEDALQVAFDSAEIDTAHHFNNKPCSMETVEGKESCVICYFRRKVRDKLKEMDVDLEQFTKNKELHLYIKDPNNNPYNAGRRR